MITKCHGCVAAIVAFVSCMADLREQNDTAKGVPMQVGVNVCI